MKRLFTLLLLTLCFAVSALAQKYDDPSVHYYVETSGQADTASVLLFIVEAEGYVRCNVVPRQREKCTDREHCIDALERAAYGATVVQRDTKRTTARYDVFVSHARFGFNNVPTYRRYALSKDRRDIIMWDDNNTEHRRTYREVNIEDLLPKEQRFDFLN